MQPLHLENWNAGEGNFIIIIYLYCFIKVEQVTSGIQSLKTGTVYLNNIHYV